MGDFELNIDTSINMSCFKNKVPEQEGMEELHTDANVLWQGTMNVKEYKKIKKGI